jgi:hypothetical protein
MRSFFIFIVKASTQNLNISTTELVASSSSLQSAYSPILSTDGSIGMDDFECNQTSRCVEIKRDYETMPKPMKTGVKVEFLTHCVYSEKTNSGTVPAQNGDWLKQNIETDGSLQKCEEIHDSLFDCLTADKCESVCLTVKLSETNDTSVFIISRQSQLMPSSTKLTASPIIIPTYEAISSDYRIPKRKR